MIKPNSRARYAVGKSRTVLPQTLPTRGKGIRIIGDNGQAAVEPKQNLIVRA